jgi:hypothetical protein
MFYSDTGHIQFIKSMAAILCKVAACADKVIV